MKTNTKKIDIVIDNSKRKRRIEKRQEKKRNELKKKKMQIFRFIFAFQLFSTESMY